MCKICSNCKNIMNYDPYFEAEVCLNCGMIERKKNDSNSVQKNGQIQAIEIVRSILGVKIANF